MNDIYFRSAEGLFISLFVIFVVVILVSFKKGMKKRDEYYDSIIKQNNNGEIKQFIKDVKTTLIEISNYIKK